MTEAVAPYVLLSQAPRVTGYTVKAIRRKLESGVWVLGREVIKAPDGRLHLCIAAYRDWVERGRA
jgi:hypothetical protein